jgi:hypothetical protein
VILRAEESLAASHSFHRPNRRSSPARRAGAAAIAAVAKAGHWHETLWLDGRRHQRFVSRRALVWNFPVFSMRQGAGKNFMGKPDFGSRFEKVRNQNVEKAFSPGFDPLEKCTRKAGNLAIDNVYKIHRLTQREMGGRDV